MEVIVIAARMKAVLFFLMIAGLYSAWTTGFTFEFKECRMFPTYSMLASGFSEGHLYIQESTAADTVVRDGKRYIFSGPVPALLRLPFKLLFGWEVATGLMIALFCAGVGVFFAFTIDEMMPPDTNRKLSVTKAIFILVFLSNGICLHMVTIPSLHHESISAAMCFLMISIYFVHRLYMNRFKANTGISILIGLSLSFSVASRFSYVYAVIALGGLLFSTKKQIWFN